MRACRSIDQLPGYPHPIPRPPHAALKQVAHTEFAAYLLYIDAAALIGKCGRSSDHEKPMKSAERRSDFLYHSICKVLLVRIAAHILERQDSDGRLVREWRSRT